jgi:hypothetical protein
MGRTVPLLTTEGGITHWMTEEEGGKLVFSATQDAEAILDANKAAANTNDGYSPSRELRRVATIPDIVGLKWLHEEGWWYQDPKYADRLARKLNDPDWRHLRTAPGRVGLSNGRIR